MIYNLLDNKFNILPGCLQSVARQYSDIVMLNLRSGNDSESLRAMITVSFHSAYFLRIQTILKAINPEQLIKLSQYIKSPAIAGLYGNEAEWPTS